MPSSPPKWMNILIGNVTEPLENVLRRITYLQINSLVDQRLNSLLRVNSFRLQLNERMKEDSLKEHTIQLINSLPFNVTKDTRLAIFQYKIIHHILPTNSTLFRDSIKEHYKCHLCGERQTLTHLFVTCSEARLFWPLLLIGGAP